VTPADDYNVAGELRFYEVRIRIPEPTDEELKPVEYRNKFMRDLAQSGQLSPDAYKEWQNYSRKIPKSNFGDINDCLFCKKDTDIIIDNERGVITEIYILLDGDVIETIKYEYKFITGKYVPAKVEFDDGETKFEMFLSGITSDVDIPDKLFNYKKNPNNDSREKFKFRYLLQRMG